MEILKDLLVQGEIQQLKIEIKEALTSGYSAEDILYRGLVSGMDIVGQKMSSGEIFIPEVLLSAKAMEAAFDVLQPLLGQRGEVKRGTVVIGTVENDVHDIGKNLVIIMLKGAGFDIVDLGINVPVKKFVDAIKKEKPDILGMSAMLTTTMQEMEKVIKALNDAGIRENVKVMVGGAPLNAEWASKIGADAYGRDCVMAAQKVKELVAEKKRGLQFADLFK